MVCPALSLLTADEVHALEPNVSDKVTAALYAPTAAIVSPWEYALALAETAVVNGCEPAAFRPRYRHRPRRGGLPPAYPQGEF